MSIFTRLFTRPDQTEAIAPVEPIEVLTSEPEEVPELQAKLRKTPRGDEQRDFFVPVLADVPLRDSVHLMDIAPYRLSHKSKATEIRYNVNDTEILIKGHPDYGLATIKDYDITIHMISHLNIEAQRWRDGLTDKPPRKYRPNTYDILKFCRRGDGGKQHTILVDALYRLENTNIGFISEDEEYTAEGSGVRLDRF